MAVVFEVAKNPANFINLDGHTITEQNRLYTPYTDGNTVYRKLIPMARTETDIEGFIQEMAECGAGTGIENGVHWVKGNKALRYVYFASRFAELKRIIADMSLDDFAETGLQASRIQQVATNIYGDWVYECESKTLMPLDEFVRNELSTISEKFYIGGTFTMSEARTTP